MDAPDKIYISPNIENRTWLIGKADTVNIEYIRKDAILEWLNRMLGISAQAFEFQRSNAYGRVIEKLNSM